VCAQVLYALALVPVGLLADRVDRPRLLAGGIALWSLLTVAASQAQGFGQARLRGPGA
jgi:MFS family permease